MQKLKAEEPEKVLVVDDSVETLEVIKRNLQTKKYLVVTATNVQDAIVLLEHSAIDLVITDLRMPNVGGMELIRYVRENHKNTEVLVITGFPSVQSAVESIKLGAEEYLAKPFTEDELFQAVQKTLNKLQAARAIQSKPDLIGESFGIMGESEAMIQIFNTIEKIAPTMASVLITGESGTGKELAARALHYRSKQARAPFVPVNCAAIPHELLESELFGHVKGAYTGAVETRAGFFQAAHNGTIFLDEISSMSLPMQAKLLRVLQEREFYMVGDHKPIHVDVRIIAATNVDLPSLVNKGVFREDLFYRLNVVNIRIPPLRERGNDVFLLAGYYNEKYAKEIGRKKRPVFSDQVMEIFKDYSWPGNIRELQNLIYQLVIMTEGNRIEVSDLPPAMRHTFQNQPGVNKSLREMEKEYILKVLSSVKDNKTEAAKILGIDRKTLREKLKEL